MSYKQKLLDLINEDNQTSLTLEQLRFSQPTAIIAGEGNNRNTKVVVYGVESAGYSGLYPFTFERLDFAAQFAGQSVTAEVSSTAFSLEDVLASISEKYGVTLYPEDFTTPDLGPDSNFLTVIPKENSYYWLPTPLTVEVVSELIDIADTLPHVMLPGFEYPTLKLNDIVDTLPVTSLPGFEYPTLTVE